MSNKDKVSAIEQEVLRVYTKENPSTFDIEISPAVYKKVQEESFNTYSRLMCFPTRMFKGADLIEFGSGTGEFSVFFLQQGATGTFVEMNPLACERSIGIFNKFAPGTKFKVINKSIFDYKDETKYDIVVSNGVIHHTGDKNEHFQFLLNTLRLGAFCTWA